MLVTVSTNRVIARFDVVQQKDDPARFILVEIYRRSEDPAKHKETEHYVKWRDTVEEMMAEPAPVLNSLMYSRMRNGGVSYEI